ncbi:MAG: uridine kinase [Verrucomicrobiales bacterium]|nr:uridine kinase [Verrucomicrobiales bacterium]
MERKKTNLKRPAPQLVAVVGGSGAGKTYLANQLKKELGKDALVLSLDSFYRDLSNVPLERRAKRNFDDPRAIDWECLERTLKQLISRKPAKVPCYDFATHCRNAQPIVLQPKPIIIVDGLWLLRKASIRRLFDLKIFIECRTRLRFERRMRRDVVERGRTEDSVCEQFIETVAPMHKKFVQAQARWADVVLPGTFGESDVKALAKKIAGK